MRGGKGKRRGLYGGSFFASYLSQVLDIWKEIVAVIYNIGVIYQNFRENFILSEKKRWREMLSRETQESKRREA